MMSTLSMKIELRVMSYECQESLSGTYYCYYYYYYFFFFFFLITHGTQFPRDL